jgi:tetratricopeptide (TPR) repeat protein
MGITLPVILLIFDVFLQRQAVSSLKALLLEKLPFAIFAAVFAIVAFIGQQTYAMGAVAEHGLMDRLVQSGYGLVFYPFKTLFPVQLSPMYSLPWDFNPWAPSFLLPAIFAIGVTVAAWHWRRVFPAGLATWAAYAVMASPILGLTQAGSQIAADRYTYLPMVPFALLLAAGLARVPSSRARLAAAITTLGLCVLAGLTMQQCKVWESGMTLWEHALRLDAKNPTAYTNRGNLRYLAGDADGALADMNAAIQYKPDHTEATYSRGALYEMRKEWVLAEADYAKVLQYMPEDLQTMERYATVALHANKAPQALQATRTVLAARPQKQGLWLLQAEVHLALGDAASAEADYGRALKLAPSATAYAGRATLRAKRNDGEGALADYTAALGLNPELVNVYQNRAKLRVKMGDFKGALADVSSLLKLTPKNIGAYENRAFLLSRLGQAEAARLDLQRALSLMPQNDPRRPQFQARLRQLGPSETQ